MKHPKGHCQDCGEPLRVEPCMNCRQPSPGVDTIDVHGLHHLVDAINKDGWIVEEVFVENDAYQMTELEIRLVKEQ